VIVPPTIVGSYLEIQELCPLLEYTPSTIPLPTQHNLLAVDEIQTHLKYVNTV